MVYLPREEIEGGLTPGSDYPVFSTDFGKVGMMICWDAQYADPARALALGGAELLLVPIWGGNQTLMKARAIENRVFIAASGYDYPTHILDPDGEPGHCARAGHGGGGDHRSEPPLRGSVAGRHAAALPQRAPARREGRSCAIPITL